MNFEAKYGPKIVWILDFYLVSKKTGYKKIVLYKLNFANLHLCEGINNMRRLHVYIKTGIYIVDWIKLIKFD